MSVYDSDKKEKRKQSLLDKYSEDDLHARTGINPEQEEAMEREAYSGAAKDIGDLEAGEHLDNEHSSSRAAKQESDQLADKTQDPEEDNDSNWDFNENDGKNKGRTRFKITKKKVAVGTGATLGVGAIITAIFLSSGPLAFFQMSNLLRDFHFDNNVNMSDSRMTRLWRWHKGQGYRNNLQAVGNAFADKLDARMTADGMKPIYSNRRLTGFEFDMSEPKARRAVSDLEAKGYAFDGDVNARSGTVTYTAPRGFGSTRAIRALEDNLRISIGEDGISSALSHRLIKARAGAGFHPLRNFYREAGEAFVDYARSVKKSRMDAARTGDIDAPRAPSDADADARAQADATNQHLPDDLKGDSPSAIHANIKAAFVSTIGAAGLYALICSVDDVGQAIDDSRFTDIILPLMRLGTEAVAMGDQIQFGDGVNNEEMGALFQRFSGDTDIGKLSAFAADSMQAELGKDQIGVVRATEGPNEGSLVKPADLPEHSKPGGENSGLFKVADALTPGRIGDAVCDILNAPLIGGFAIADIFDVIGAGISGGASAAAASATVNAIFVGAGIAFGDFIDSIISALAGNALECLDGPSWGSCVNIGARLSANDKAISAGGSELSQAEERQLTDARLQLKKEDMKTKSLYARYLDLKDHDSLFSKTAIQNPKFFATSSNLSYGLRSPLNNFSNIFTNIGSVFSGRANAITVDYDYGFPEYGFNLGEMTNNIQGLDMENPYENAEWIEQVLPEDERCDGGIMRLSCLNEEYGECFQTTVSESGSINTTSTRDYRELPNKCKNRENKPLTRYRFYILDTLTAKSGLCYESKEGEDEGACSELGFDEGSSSSDDSAGGAGIVGDPFAPSVDVPCPEGTEDLGTEHDGYVDGEAIPTRLCAITNLPADEDAVPGANGKAVTNSRVAGAVYAMAEDGPNLSTVSSFRSMEKQQQLWRDNTTGPDADCRDVEPPGDQLSTCDVAYPGYSNHQSGTAIDFAIGYYEAVSNTRTCEDRMRYDSSPMWTWLFENAENYGYTQLSYEAWHWDPATGPSKCNSSQP